MAEVAERSQQASPVGPDPRSRRALPGWLVVAVPAVFAFVFSGFDLGSPSLWRDEAYTKDAITRSLNHLFAMLANMDAVHGAYYVILHLFCGVFGASVVALRFPSLCAMAVATAFTAAIGRRAARMAIGPSLLADATGLIAGMLFATAPYMTYYAQMARPYAFVTMCATIASYLLLRSVDGGGVRWWIWYAVAVAFTGLFNTFGLLILPAHALTVLAIAPGSRSWLRRTALPWLIAGVLAAVVLVPLLLISFRERGQIAWLSKPTINTLRVLVTNFAGSRLLIWPMALLALGGVAAGLVDWRGGGAAVSGDGAAGSGDGAVSSDGAVSGDGVGERGRRMSPAVLALPWLVVPPAVLLVVSLVKPVYNVRYVEFCLPALSLLVAAGLVGLVRVVGKTVAASGGLGRFGRFGRGTVAWVPSGAVMLVLAIMLVPPQHAIRESSARPDNLRLASAIVAAHEQPGDVVFYLPENMRVLGTGYPAPFGQLRDMALAQSRVQSATLIGTELTNPAELAGRFTDVQRVWVVTGQSNHRFPAPATALDTEKMTLISGMHILHRWLAGQVMLTLYGR